MATKINKSELHGSVNEKFNKPKMTDDGFKIVSKIPEDDSDISDGFDSDYDEEIENEPIKNEKIKSKLSKTKYKQNPHIPTSESESELSDSNKEFDQSQNRKKSNSEYPQKRLTDDGFKIVSSIPSDDSDISDAFDSDDDFDECRNEKYDTGISKRNGELSNYNKTNDPNICTDSLKNIKKPLQQIMTDFGISCDSLHLKESSQSQKVSNTSNKTVNTTLAAKLKHSQPTVQIVDHSQRRGKLKSSNHFKHEDKTTEDDGNMKEYVRLARREVFKLGMSGFHAGKRKDTKIALAVRLGAKPNKNKVVNYKELQKQRIEEKKQQKEERELNRRMGLQVRKPESQSWKKQTGKTLSSTPGVGKFKAGVLTLSKHDIKNIKRSK